MISKKTIEKGFMLIIIVLLVVTSIPFTSGDSKELTKAKVRNILSSLIGTLPPVEVSDNYISPAEGISLDDARTAILEHLKNTEKIYTDASLSIYEITTEESWNHGGIQMFHIGLDHRWFDGIVIFKDKKILKIISGMTILNIFLADLDNDQAYEVYTNVSRGSGMSYVFIQGYDPESGKGCSMQKTMDQNCRLFIRNSTLMAKIFDSQKDNNGRPAPGTSEGKVVLKDDELYLMK